MSYLNQAQDSRRRATALAGTVAIHAALAIVVVTGLSIAGYERFDEYKPILEFPVDRPKPPPPEPQKQQETPETFVTVPPTPFDPPAPPDDWVVVDPIPDDNTLVVDRGPIIEATIDPPVRPTFTPRKARPSDNPAQWITTEDYPARALRAEAEGIAAYRLIVGTNGRVSACEVTRSTGNGQLDDATCDFIARRARFEAATDQAGAKVVGAYTGTVKWEIPD
jgi:protein TonB